VPIGAGAAQNRTVTFRFWKSATDTATASRLFSESQTVTILDGDFSVLIGNGASLVDETNAAATVAEVFAHKELFLGITVDDGNPGTTDAEISPRQQLVSTAFAFRASVAESVDNGAISNSMIDLNAVDTDQLIDSSVTNGKMAASSVTSANIVDGTITSADIEDGTITSADIKDGTIIGAKIFDGTITSADIKDGTIHNDDIRFGTITSGKIFDGTILNVDIKDGTIISANLAPNSVSAAKIAANAVGASEIAANAVGASEIASNAVNTSELRDGSVTSAKLGNGTMHAEESLRIIRGVVAEDGTITSGVGFTVTKTAVGQYTLDFTNDFTGTPVISIPNGYDGTQNVAFQVNTSLISPDTTTKSRLIVYTFNYVTLTNTGFAFTAIGPR
jgi:hypothetical protein